LFSFFSSQANGNCLFSSVSILLVGNSTLADLLRALCCLELHLNPEFYLEHPCFKYTFSFHSEFFPSKKSLLSISMSDVAFNYKLSGIDMIRQESRSMCKDKVWAPFLCVLALSSVLNKKLLFIILSLVLSSFVIFLIKLFFPGLFMIQQGVLLVLLKLITFITYCFVA